MSRNIRALRFGQAPGLGQGTLAGNIKVRTLAAKTTALNALLVLGLAFSAQSGWAYSVSGSTYTTNGSSSDVQSAVNAAPSGSTVVIPAGTYSWSSGVTVNKSLTLTGSGSVQIQDNMASGFALSLTSSTDGHIRVSGINFLTVANNAGGAGYCISVDRTDQNGRPGTQYTVIFTNCTFDSGNVFNYSVFCQANGVIWSQCTFTNQMSSLGLTGISFTCAKYGPTSTWNTPDTMGSAQDSTSFNGHPINVGDTAAGWCGVAGLNDSYVENCTIMNGTSGSMNCDDNSRVVVRYCTVQDAQLFSHGQDTSQFGGRHYEIYNNTFKQVNSSLNNQGWTSFRGNVCLVANNVMDAIAGKSSVNFQCQQINRGTGPGGCQTGYPANRQVGSGWSAGSSATYGNPVVSQDGTGYTLDPCYVWNNSGAGGSGYANYCGVSQYSPDSCGSGLQAASFVQAGRDYIVGTARPGWAPYTYPHPLVSGGSPASTPAAPQNLRVQN